MKSIEINHLNFSYDGKTNIFEDASFEANFGEVTLVAGHSGEGKSTLLSIISGIIPDVIYGKMQGEILVDGESIIGKKLGTICRKVGVVLQNADEQIVHKLVEDEISFGLENLAFKPSDMDYQIDAVLKLMKLDRKAYTRSLSGGQKQRLITASTLAMGQKVIILDEPLANLDNQGAKLLMSTLRGLAEKAGYSVIVVEHRLDVVLPYVDNVWHIGDKKITRVIDKKSYLVEQTKTIEDECHLEVGNEKLFELKNVAFKVKDREILKDITCDIIKGARTVLLGENGCGKTTLLRIIARLNKLSGGTVTQHLDPKFKQKSRGSKHWFKKVGIVYQNPDYQLFMPTVRKEIYFGAESIEYADKIAKLFEIEHLLDRHPHSLSEGQKRRVSIAAVVATNPDVLLLDEPTVGQDYKGLAELVKILNELHEENHNTMITITHDVRCAEALCDKALLIEEGKIKSSGEKELVREYFASYLN